MHHHTLPSSLLLILALAAPSGHAQTLPASPAGASDPAPTFVPPLRGAPERRVGGATRAPAIVFPWFKAIAPRETALTAQASPTLYWFIRPLPHASPRLTIRRAGSERALFEIALPIPTEEGLQRIELAALKVSLQPGPVYRWQIELTDGDGFEESRTGGMLRYRPLKAHERHASSTPAELDARGYWYDAFALAERNRHRDPTLAPALRHLLTRQGQGLEKLPLAAED